MVHGGRKWEVTLTHGMSKFARKGKMVVVVALFSIFTSRKWGSHEDLPLNLIPYFCFIKLKSIRRKDSRYMNVNGMMIITAGLYEKFNEILLCSIII